MTKYIVIAIIVIGFFIAPLFMGTRVPAGYEAILVNQYSQKGVDDTPLVTGRVFYNPFTQELVKYPIYVQTKDYDAFQVNAKDGSMFTVDPTISYRIAAGSSPKIYTKYRKDIKDITGVVMLQFVKDAFRLVLNKYTTDEILFKRADIENDIAKVLKETAGADGIVIETLTSGLGYPQSIVDSITNKNKAVQEAQRVENEVKIAEANAKIQQTNAEASARAKLTEAEANAKAIEIQSRAIQAQGGENYVKLQWIKEVGSKWNGVLPSTTLSEGGMTMMQLPK